MTVKYKNNCYAILLLFCACLSSLVFLKPIYFPADYIPYTEIYNNTYDGLPGVEPGFKLVVYIFNIVNIPYVMFAMMVFCFCFLTKIIYAKKMASGLTGGYFIIFYLCFYAFLHELTQLRIAIAMTMCYIGVYYYFFEKKKWPSLCWILIGVLFHYSVFFWCLTLFISNYRRLIACILTLTLSLSIIVKYANGIVAFLPNEKMALYIHSLSSSLQNTDSVKLLSINNIVFALLFCIIFYVKKKIKLSENATNFINYVQCSNILAFFLFYSFGGVPVIAYRFAELLRAFTPLAMAILCVNLKDIKSRMLVFIIFLLLSFLILIVTLRAVSLPV